MPETKIAKKITEDEVMHLYGRYQYALLFQISEMRFYKTAEIGDIQWDEVLEARFFDSGGELHIFNDGDGLQAFLIDDESLDGIDSNIVCYKLAGKFCGAVGGTIICEKEYFTYDEDGQLQIAAVRLESVR